MTQESITEDITIAITTWETYDWKDDDLWESFQDDFKGYTKDDFRLVYNNNVRRLCKFLRKQGVWIEKSKTTIARSLFNALQEEEPISRTEAEIIAYEEKEKFASYQISQLINSDFGKKPRKSHVLTPASSSGTPPAATSPTLSPSAPATASTSINPTHTSGTKPTPGAYMQPPSTGFPPAAHTPPGTGPTPATYMQPSGITPIPAYVQPSGIGYTPTPYATPAPYTTPADHTQPSTGPAHPAVYHPPSASQPPAATVTTSIGHGRELSNLAKIYTDEAKYSGRNDSFTFKLAIFHDICSRADVPPEAKMKAFPTMLKGLALDYYYSNISTSVVALNFDQVCNSIRNYFEGAEYKRSVLSKWNELTLKSVISKNEGKPMEECLEKLIDELRHLQHGLDPELRTDRFIHNKLINACQNLPACQYACFKPADSLAGLINNLRSSIITYTQANPTSEAFFTDRRYHKQYQTPPLAYARKDRGDNQRNNQPRVKKKRCFVCNKEGCWSSKHTREEREDSKNKFKERFSRGFDRRANQYIAEHEGVDYERDDDSESIDDAAEALMIDIGSSSPSPLDQENLNTDIFITSFGTIHSAQTISTELANRSFDHAITGSNPGLQHHESDPFTYITSERYNSDEFYGIMIDTGASKRSTAGYGQYLAYKKHVTPIQVNKTKAGAINVQFGIGSTSSIGSLLLDTPIGIIEFHVVEADTPFLLCLEDMDKLNVYFNNLENVVITSTKSVPMVRRFGHPFLLWDKSLQSFIANSFNNNPCFLTDTELRQLHRRFGHPSAEKLHKVLERSGHETDKKIIDNLTKYCTHCQKHGKLPSRFKFTLKEDTNFNYSILVDIMYIDGSLILHIVNEAIRF